VGHDYRRQDHLQKRGRLKAHSEPIPESYNSCSHGAGRRTSRTRPRKQFSRADLVEVVTELKQLLCVMG